jgi:radical SAM protein with 4Fe4S-binding SPASM domain
MLPKLMADFENYKRFWGARVDEVAYLDYQEMKTKKTGLKFLWACPQIWQRMAVFWDGTILPCNHDYDAKLALGKVGEITISDAWNGKKLNELREIHRKGEAHLVEACDGCYLRDSEIAKGEKNEK